MVKRYLLLQLEQIKQALIENGTSEVTIEKLAVSYQAIESIIQKTGEDFPERDNLVRANSDINHIIDELISETDRLYELYISMLRDLCIENEA